MYMPSKLTGCSTTGEKPARVTASGDDFACIREEDVRAGDGDQRLKGFVRHVEDAEDAGLTDFDEENGLLADACRDGHRQDDFVGTAAKVAAVGLQLNLDLRRILFEEDLGGIRHLDGEVLQVQLFDREGRGFLLFAHDGVFLVKRWMKIQKGAGKQRLQLAGLVEGDEIVATTDMGIADVDLRHGAPAGFLHHLVAQRRIEVDTDFLDSATPRARKSCSARMQKGRPPCCTSGRAAGSLTPVLLGRQRQPGLVPGRDAPIKGKTRSKPCFFRGTDRLHAADAGFAADDQGCSLQFSRSARIAHRIWRPGYCVLRRGGRWRNRQLPARRVLVRPRD